MAAKFLGNQVWVTVCSMSYHVSTGRRQSIGGQERPKHLVVKKALFPFGVLVSGCASTVMEGYVGKDITEVILAEGPPMNKLVLPDGRTAFQWSKTVSSISINQYGGYGHNTDCVYTYFAKENREGSYTVTGFQSPELECE
jgi:hypothetical protein